MGHFYLFKNDRDLHATGREGRDVGPLEARAPHDAGLEGGAPHDAGLERGAPHDLSWKVRSARDRSIRTFHIRVRSKLSQNKGDSARIHQKSKNFRNDIVQHFLQYLAWGSVWKWYICRNSEKLSSKSEQNAMKMIKFSSKINSQNFAEKCEKV